MVCPSRCLEIRVVQVRRQTRCCHSSRLGGCTEKEQIDRSPTHCRIDSSIRMRGDTASFGPLPAIHLPHLWVEAEASSTRGRVVNTSAWPTLSISRCSNSAAFLADLCTESAPNPFCEALFGRMTWMGITVERRCPPAKKNRTTRTWEFFGDP